MRKQERTAAVNNQKIGIKVIKIGRKIGWGGSSEREMRGNCVGWTE